MLSNMEHWAKPYSLLVIINIGTSYHLPNLPMDQTNHLEIHQVSRMSMDFAVRVKNGNKLEDFRMAKYMDERNRSQVGMNHDRRYRHHLQ
jgi:hypothetical protein